MPRIVWDGRLGKLENRPERELWIQLSLIYGRTVSELQASMSSSEFSELAEYIKRNTAHPDIWWSQAVQTSKIISALTGEWIDPREHVPGQVDFEARRQARMKLAEQRMDKAARKY